MSHYRLSKLHEQHLKLQEDAEEYKIKPGNDVGTAKPKDKKEEFLSNILARLNELFVTDNLQKIEIHILLVLKILIETPFRNAASLHNTVDTGQIIGIVPKLCHHLLQDLFSFLLWQVEKCLFGQVHPSFMTAWSYDFLVIL